MGSPVPGVVRPEGWPGPTESRATGTGSWTPYPLLQKGHVARGQAQHVSGGDLRSRSYGGPRGQLRSHRQWRLVGSPARGSRHGLSVLFTALVFLIQVFGLQRHAE